MTQKQIHQQIPLPNMHQDYAFCISRKVNGVTWYLYEGEPRTWTQKQYNAKIFATPQAVTAYVLQYFSPKQMEELQYERIPVGY